MVVFRWIVEGICDLLKVKIDDFQSWLSQWRGTGQDYDYSSTIKQGNEKHLEIVCTRSTCFLATIISVPVPDIFLTTQ